MINLNKINSIANTLYQQLLNWGAKEDNFQIDDKDSPKFVCKTITAQKDGFDFRVILYVTENDDSRLSIDQSSRTFLKGDLSIVYFIKNSNKIELSIEKEGLKQKFGKLLGKNDLQVYNNQFDKTFLIKSNHDYAYASILDKKIQQKLLAQATYFSQYSIQGDQVRYKTELNPDLLEKEVTHFIDLMEIGFLLAKNTQNWQTPQ